MEQVKRQRINSVNNYNNNKKQKIQVETNRCPLKELITCIEDLSNELIYEIFELLDFHDVYNIFYSLNTRFYNLIANSSLPIEVNLSSISKSLFQRYNKDVIMRNKHRIYSLHLSNICLYDDVYSPIHILAECLRLETLNVNNIESKHLEYLVPVLISLPCLSSLSISSADNVQYKTYIYSQIIRMTSLKYCSLSLKGSHHNELSLPTLDQYSPIEHLIIKHCISNNQLYSLLSHTPQLRRLHLSDISNSWSKYTKPFPFVLAYLTKVSMGLNCVDFVQFQQMIIDMFHRVQVLHISIDCNSDQAYMSSNRWEQLIVSHMPNLRVFDIRHGNWAKYIIANNYNVNPMMPNTPTDKFSSSFWIKRQWFFIQQYIQERHRNCTVFYSINPYRRKFYTICNQPEELTCLNSKETELKSVKHLQIHSEKQTNTCKYYFPNVTTLTFKDGFKNTQNSIAFNVNRVFPLKQLTKLIIQCDYLSLTKLIELLHWTPHIHTLEFESMPLYGVTYNSTQHNQLFQLVSSRNIIRNVTFKRRCTFEKLQILVALFPQTQHLTVNIQAKDLKSCVRFLLEKTNRNTRNLYSICLAWVSANWVAKLKMLIDSEKLLDNYTLKLFDMDLYLWW
ncbi:unnamed protein product [Adineta steineri]|uniref:F-box domain-containing protein n=1 Tax=Adineta steineri TaxID=433720 RepID=A0A813RH17_9BILA|nr:unnamed protein product [Adineta steineri]